MGMKISKEELLKLEGILQKTQKDLTCLRQIASMFKSTVVEKQLQEENKAGCKTQIHILN